MGAIQSCLTAQGVSTFDESLCQTSGAECKTKDQESTNRTTITLKGKKENEYRRTESKNGCTPLGSNIEGGVARHNHNHSRPDIITLHRNSQSVTALGATNRDDELKKRASNFFGLVSPGRNVKEKKQPSIACILSHSSASHPGNFFLMHSSSPNSNILSSSDDLSTCSAAVVLGNADLQVAGVRKVAFSEMAIRNSKAPYGK
jgi:hypothetical protein